MTDQVVKIGHGIVVIINAVTIYKIYVYIKVLVRYYFLRFSYHVLTIMPLKLIYSGFSPCIITCNMRLNGKCSVRISYNFQRLKKDLTTY